MTNPLCSSLNLDKLQELSRKNTEVSAEARVIKVMEETGEFAAAVLCHLGHKNASKSAEPNVLEEGVDALVCILDVLFSTGHTVEEIQDMMDTKNEKWNMKMINQLCVDFKAAVEAAKARGAL